ncbi:uncharacterized protein LOC131950244 [Physella acuta]|uniref:uncharacterized protein LOC131950244 n=1 Tax=Physella acuta TaxID=109671 RepID=UPI0027DC2950|nr:uncharacterized protein LOC131950244 [Physella acuta]
MSFLSRLSTVVITALNEIGNIFWRLQDLFLFPTRREESEPEFSVNPKMLAKVDTQLIMQSPSTYSAFKEQIEIVAEIIREYDTDDVVVVVIVVGLARHKCLDSRNFKSQSLFEQELKSIAYLGHCADVAMCLKKARENCLSSYRGRPGVKKIAVFLNNSDYSDNENAAINEANKIKLMVSEMVVVSVGNRNHTLLNQLASKKEYVLSYSNTLELSEDGSRQLKVVTCTIAPKYDAPADILFVIDSSRSITRENYLKEMEFVVGLSKYFNIGPANAEFSAMVNSDDSEMLFYLATKAHTSIEKAFLQAPYFPRKTSTTTVLQKAIVYAFSINARSKYKKLAIVIVNGDSCRRKETKCEANLLKDFGVHVIAIGFGNAKKKDLEAIASSKMYAFYLGNYDVGETVYEEIVKFISEITSEVVETYGTTTTYFQIFMYLLKQYWSKLITITNRNLVLEYFHKNRNNRQEWFEMIKLSHVTRYLQNVNQEGPDIDLVLSKHSSHEQFKDALVFTSVVLSYSNNLLEVLKEPLQLEKISTELKQFYQAVETISKAISLFQALMPWSFSACRKEIDIQIDELQTTINNMNFSFDNQQLSKLALSKTLVVYDVDILCSVLGLQTKFSQFAKQVSVDMWLHDLQQSQVVNWLKRNGEGESLPQADRNSDREPLSQTEASSTLRYKLIFLGFTSWKAASIADNISEDWINHQTALDLATSHILDMFQCHPVLTVASGFPYNCTVIDALFDQTVEMNDGHTVSERCIKVMNVSDISNKKVQSDFLKQISNSIPNENIKLYHGTSHDCAKSILTKGIRLGRGRQFQDFSHGDGFYLSYVYNHAKERAIHKSKRPAVIVYCINEVTLQQFSGLILFRDMDCWGTTVKYCRNGYEGLMPDNFPAYHYVAGPMCMNVEDVIEGHQEPVTHVVEKNQLCVKKPELARHFNLPDNIVCVIFYKETI